MWVKVIGRRIQKFRESFGIILPKDWVLYNKLDKGEEVSLITFSDVIIVLPERVSGEMVRKFEELRKDKRFKELLELVRG